MKNMKNILLFTFFLGAMLPATAQPGTLDPTFADNAEIKNINFLENAIEYTTHAIVDAQDRIWIAGLTLVDNDYQIILVRLTPDGEYDTSFNSTGYSLINVADNSYEQVEGIALQDNKLLLAGFKFVDGVTTQFVLRFNTEGFLDQNFGTLGVANLPFEAQVSNMTVDATGHIYLSGMMDGSVCATKLLPNGTPDNSFSNDGFRSVTFASNDESVAISVGDDGKVWIFGNSTADNISRGSITSFNPNGTNNWDLHITARKVYTWPNSWNFEVMDGFLNADGSRFYLAGGISGGGADAAIIAVDIAGDFVTDFGNGGRATFNPTLGGEEIITSIREGDNGIYATMVTEEFPTGTNAAMVYFNTAGALNTEFGVGGWSSFNIVEQGDDHALAMAKQSDGRLILLGVVEGGPANTYGFAARVNTSEDVSSVNSVSLQKAGVFPNPANNEINIALSDIRPEGEWYRIYNVTGQLMDSGLLQDSNKRIQVSALVPGTYQILIGERAYTRFVKTY